MMLRPLFLFLLTLASAAADDWPHASNTQKAGENPLGPLEQVRKMTVPEGFKVSLFAGEPDVRQPVAFTFDDRGRLWVVECYTYSGKKEFDEEKRDRIVIFEDTDNDGRFDKRVVFWDGGLRMFGIEWGFGGVWILQAPHLSFIPDRNFDDVPDGPPEARLDGFTTGAAHNNVNGLRWGPDGWLWGRHGMLQPSKAAVVGTPEEERREFKASIWRYHPVRNQFEVVCQGGINPWGFDWNEVGEMFFTNNVNGHLFHLIPGAHYRVKFIPAQDALTQPFLNVCADHQHWEYGTNWNQGQGGRGGATTDELGGGHSHCGGMIYLGDNWPVEYRGTMFMHNTHGKRVNHELLERRGSGYVAKHGVDFLQANTEWYRGVELKYGPDGGVYLLDWCDYGECHDHDGVHRGSGRIYKVTYGEPEEGSPFDMRTFSDLDLVELQLVANDWWVRQARRLLQERSLEARLGDDVREKLMRIYHHPDVTRRLRAMWCLYSTGLVDGDWLQIQLRDQNEHVRAWALRLLTDGKVGFGGVRLAFSRLAVNDPSALVRLHLASALQRLPVGNRVEVAILLAKREEDRGDANLPLMIWFAVEDSLYRNLNWTIELAEASVHRLTRRLIARKLAAGLKERPDGLEKLVEALGRAEREEVQHDLLDGLLDALSGSRRVKAPTAWAAAYEALNKSSDAELDAKLAQLAVIFADRTALEKFRITAADTSAGVETRRRALEVLVQAGGLNMQDLLNASLEERGLAIPAMRGLALTPGEETARRILKRYPELSRDEQRVAISVLTSRQEFAAALLDAVAAGAIPSRDLSAFDARQIQSLGDEGLNEKLNRHWGTVRTAGVGKKKELERYRAILAEGSAADRSRGRVLFQQRCAACHVLWGEGGQAGPDLTGSVDHNLDYLLENILDPNASVAQNFRLTTVELKNGQVLGGFVEEELGTAIRLRSQDKLHTISRERIKKRTVSGLSLMPEGILNGLKNAELRDLFAYLRGEQQATPPGE